MEGVILFNWHALDRDDVLHWAVVHAMVQKTGRADLEALALIRERSDKFTNVEIVMLINGVEYDGARLISDLYESMSKSFDRAVDDRANERINEKWVAVDEIIYRAKEDIIEALAREER